MTPEERDEYKKRIAERLKNDMGDETTVTTTVTTTTYAVVRKGSKEEIPLEDMPVQARGVGSEEDKIEVAYGEERNNERLSSHVRVQLLEQAEDDKRKAEEEEFQK